MTRRYSDCLIGRTFVFSTPGCSRAAQLEVIIPTTQTRQKLNRTAVDAMEIASTTFHKHDMRSENHTLDQAPYDSVYKSHKRSVGG